MRTLTTVLFDLDGTLLPMDNDAFTKGYFKLLVQKLAPLGYAPDELIAAVWEGTVAMVQNDGSRTNEEVFWERFAAVAGDRVLRDRPVMEDFYRNEFNEARRLCGVNPRIGEAVKRIKNAGLRIALATNPIFPAVATEARIRWAGFAPSDFELYTTYENIGYCKPNPAYYAEVRARLGCSPDECLMVGNDAEEDTAARGDGIDVFLITDHLINLNSRDLSAEPHGSFDDLLTFLRL